MKTNDPIYVSFHIGRNPRTHDQGHLTFTQEETFQDLLKRCADKYILVDYDIDEDGNECPLADEKWYIHDLGDNKILEGRKNIEAMTGYLDWDGEYDTDYVTTTDKLGEAEMFAIWKAFVNRAYMSDELKDTICDLLEYKRALSIKTYPTNLEVQTKNGVETIDLDGQFGEFDEDEWREDLEEHDWCPESIDMIVDKLKDLEVIDY